MRRKAKKPVFAFAAISPMGNINRYWIEPEARMIRRNESWPAAQARGWRVRKLVIALAKDATNGK